MDFRDTLEWTIPQGSVTQVTDSLNRVIWQKEQPSYFYVEDVSGSANTLSITKKNANAPTITVYKSSNQQTWTSMGNTSTTAITATIPANGKLYLKATTSTWCTDTDAYNSNEINCSGNFNVGGNIMSLLYGDNFENQTTFSTTYTFTRLFYGKNTLISAANLVLPATTLTDNCYLLMFCNCTALTTAPALPANTLDEHCYDSMFKDCTSLSTTPTISATTLANSCCRRMFQGCTALTTATVLPATTLAQSCYVDMFSNCTALTTAPALPATTLAPGCYYSMFSGCSALTTAPALPATTLANLCYVDMFSRCTSLATAPALPATTLASECYEGMFYGCTRLTTPPALPATTLDYACYNDMFYGCTRLTTPPILPATTLTEWCYRQMFYGCTNLNQVTTYADDISATNCLEEWLANVAASGTFHNEGTAVYTVDSPSGIPQGWTEVSNYFYVEDISGFDNTLSIKKSKSSAPDIEVFCSTDRSNWTSMGTTSTTAITATIPANGKLYLRATANKWYGSYRNNYISASGNHNVGGNIMSLLYDSNFENQTSFPVDSTYTFSYLFDDDTNLISAEHLILPATTLTQGCYSSMFYGCTSLTTAPELPATTLAPNCYSAMFRDCTSLTTAPELPATTLPTYCYNNMFQNCTSLTQAPTLPATTLAEQCYSSMFSGCTSLTQAPELPATALNSHCYSCYAYMFSGCTNLNKVVTYAQNISVSGCLTNWLQGVAATGNFHNLGGATYTSGASGIPEGWTEHNTL